MLKLSNDLITSLTRRELTVENIVRLHFEELRALSVVNSKQEVVDRLGVKYSTYQKYYTMIEVKLAEDYLDRLYN